MGQAAESRPETFAGSRGASAPGQAGTAAVVQEQAWKVLILNLDLRKA